MNTYDLASRCAALMLAALTAGCAVVKYADGERVAIRHETTDLASLQPQADAACVASGGRAPARLVANVPTHTALPASMVPHTATFRCL